MLQIPKGNLTTPSGRHYAWLHVESTPFIACLSWSKSKAAIQKLVADFTSGFADELAPLVYHRFDVLPLSDRKMCFHINQLSSADACSLFLSPGVFNSPFEYLVRPETKSVVQGYLAYFNDRTQLIVNGRLKSPVTKTQVRFGLRNRSTCSQKSFFMNFKGKIRNILIIDLTVRSFVFLCT